MQLHKNMSLRMALRVAARLGCHIEQRWRTGEIEIRAPGGTPRWAVNGRRKDAGKGLIAFLRKIQEDRSRSNTKTA